MDKKKVFSFALLAMTSLGALTVNAQTQQGTAGSHEGWENGLG